MAFGKLTPPGKSSKTSEVIWGVAAIVFFGAVGLTTIPELFPNSRPLFGDRVILDDDGVRHPHHAQLVPWRDIVRASTHAARWDAHGPEFTMLHLWLIDDPARYRGPINIHASCDEEMFPLPPTMDFSLEHCRVPAEEVLRFAQEKITAHRA